MIPRMYWLVMLVALALLGVAIALSAYTGDWTASASDPYPFGALTCSHCRHETTTTGNPQQEIQRGLRDGQAWGRVNHAAVK
jgi:hypothetical protein